jgi:hypothetical protein
MSETAEEKSKRAFLKVFREHEWNNQITVFFTDYNQRLNFLDYSRNIRRNLSRYRPNTGFLWRHMLSTIRNFNDMTSEEHFSNFEDDPNGVVMPCITFFTYPRLSKEEFQDFVEGLLDSHSLSGVPVYVKRKTQTIPLCIRYAGKVERQKPHNLKKYFDLATGPKRFGVINKSKLVSLEDVIKKRPSTEA